MNASDWIRILFVAVFGFGAALMLITNYVAFMVLRPPKQLGFLWWHVSAISLSFLCFGSVAISQTLERLNKDQGVGADWRTYVTALGVITFTVAQVIIFNVERRRLAHKIALERGTEKPELDVE